MLQKRIERELERKIKKYGIMGSESISITLTITDAEKEEFTNCLSDSYNYEIDGNTLTIIYSEQ